MPSDQRWYRWIGSMSKIWRRCRADLKQTVKIAQNTTRNIDVLSSSMARCRMVSESVYPLAIYSAATATHTISIDSKYCVTIQHTASPRFISLIDTISSGIRASLRLIMVGGLGRNSQMSSIQCSSIQLRHRYQPQPSKLNNEVTHHKSCLSGRTFLEMNCGRFRFRFFVKIDGCDP